MNKLDDLGVTDETAVLISSDHGEAFVELGVYADHQAADETTCHIPAVLSWPGVAPRVDDGLHYHFDIAATVLALAGFRVPGPGDGQPIALDGTSGRDHLVLSQGAWSCQRGVRFGDHLYLRTWHDGFHGHWSDEMLFDVVRDPHETTDLWDGGGPTAEVGASLLKEWTSTQLERTGLDDPLEVVCAEGGAFHVRGHLRPYAERLRTTGRDGWAQILEERHAGEM